MHLSNVIYQIMKQDIQYLKFFLRFCFRKVKYNWKDYLLLKILNNNYYY
jgi:hypothetical protein